MNRRISGVKKEVNALRKSYQSTTNNVNLIQDRKAKYFDGRRNYEGYVQEAKLKSWKNFCTINDGVKTWNILYKVASEKSHLVLD